MRDPFFSKTNCDRCKGSLDGGRMMSMFNTDCLCLECIRKERKRDDYPDAIKADHEEIKRGNFSFQGIGLTERKKE